MTDLSIALEVTLYPTPQQVIVSLFKLNVTTCIWRGRTDFMKTIGDLAREKNKSTKQNIAGRAVLLTGKNQGILIQSWVGTSRAAVSDVLSW